MEEKLELGRSSFAIRAIYVFPLWFYSFLTVNKVVYVCSSVWLLAVVSREKETAACNVEFHFVNFLSFRHQKYISKLTDL